MAKKKKAVKKAVTQNARSKSTESSGFVQKVLHGVKDYWNQKSPILKFLLGFAACMILFYVIYLAPFFVEHILRPILHAEAKISSVILNILGQQTTANNDVINGPDFSVSIKNGCDGLETLAIMLSGIIVFPIAFRLKWPGIIYGSIALFILNFIRIVGLYWVGKNFSQGVFDFLHTQGGFVIFTVLGIALWIIWANWALQKSTQLQTPENSGTP